MTYTDLGLDMDTNIVNIKSVKYKIFDVLMYQATANQQCSSMHEKVKRHY